MESRFAYRGTAQCCYTFRGGDMREVCVID